MSWGLGLLYVPFLMILYLLFLIMVTGDPINCSSHRDRLMQLAGRKDAERTRPSGEL